MTIGSGPNSDDEPGDEPHGDGQYPDVDRLIFSEHNFQNIVNELNYLRNVVACSPPPTTSSKSQSTSATPIFRGAE